MQMTTYQESFSLDTETRGMLDITQAVNEIVLRAGIKRGICHVFPGHTSAAVLICENADIQVQRDLDAFMQRLVPDGDPLFKHRAEGPDDMPAHVRTVLSGSSVTVPVDEGRCLLGTWQGLFFWEHRTQPHARRVIVTVQGD